MTLISHTYIRNANMTENNAKHRIDIDPETVHEVLHGLDKIIQHTVAARRYNKDVSGNLNWRLEQIENDVNALKSLILE